MEPNYIKTGVKRLRLSVNLKHYLNEQTKDVTFVVKGVRIPAHKVILSACSDILERMVYARTDFKEHKDLIEIKETTPEVFRYVLKVIYSDEFEPKDISHDPNFAMDVYKLVDKLQINDMTAIIEEELVRMIAIDSFETITEFANTYKLAKLLASLKEFVIKNNEHIIHYIERGMKAEPTVNYDRMIQSLNLNQNQIIQMFVNISADNHEMKHIQRYRQLIQFELCSIKDINSLRTTQLFEAKDLDKWIEQKFDDIANKNLLLDNRCQKSNDELKEKSDLATRLANDYNELNQMFVDLMVHYKEIKEIFEPFIDGMGGRVNQYVYNKTNCYLGKLAKKFSFKY